MISYLWHASATCSEFPIPFFSGNRFGRCIAARERKWGTARKGKCSKRFDLPGVATYRCIQKELSLIQKELPQSSFKELPRLLPTTVCRSSIPTFSPVIPFGKILPTHAACHIYSHMVSQNAFCASGHTRKIKCQHLIFRVWPLTAVSKRSLV